MYRIHKNNIQNTTIYNSYIVVLKMEARGMIPIVIISGIIIVLGASLLGTLILAEVLNNIYE